MGLSFGEVIALCERMQMDNETVRALIEGLPRRYPWHGVTDLDSVRCHLEITLKWLRDYKSGEYTRRQAEIDAEIRLAQAVRKSSTQESDARELLALLVKAQEYAKTSGLDWSKFSPVQRAVIADVWRTAGKI